MTLSPLARSLAILLVSAFIAVAPVSATFAQSSDTPVTEPAQAPETVTPVVEPATEENAVTEPSGEATAGTQISTLPHDLSPWGMFMAADWVVKGVMIGLAFASLVTWTVWLAKSLELAAAKRRVSQALERIIAAKSLEEAGLAMEGVGSSPATLLVRAAGHEAALSGPQHDGNAAGLKERVASHLGRIEAQAARRMTRGTGVLATIGSTAPFVGLFGTVWGIMNAFIGISQAQTTNLAVVAPGIAEALLATALGLVAAIPAVVIYNVFARAIAGYRLLLADASAAVERLVSRDIDRRALTGGHGAARAQAAE